MTVDLKMWQIRNFIDDRIETMKATISNIESKMQPGVSADFHKGYVYALETIKVTYLLTPEELNESHRVRREMFG